MIFLNKFKIILKTEKNKFIDIVEFIDLLCFTFQTI
jgi:hypothetical protein